MTMIEQTYQLLVADDDDDFRQAVCDIFAPFFRLIEAGSGEEALELAAREEIHLALFDMHMKQLTGLEALKQLRELHVIAPCILMTADYTDALRDDAEQADAFTVLRKPVARRELMGTVAHAVEIAYDDGAFTRRLLCG
jgi:two-component system, response regulator PdtaR